MRITRAIAAGSVRVAIICVGVNVGYVGYVGAVLNFAAQCCEVAIV